MVQVLSAETAPGLALAEAATNDMVLAEQSCCLRCCRPVMALIVAAEVGILSDASGLCHARHRGVAGGHCDDALRCRQDEAADQLGTQR